MKLIATHGVHLGLIGTTIWFMGSLFAVNPYFAAAIGYGLVSGLKPEDITKKIKELMDLEG